jgi:hypothetical protein
MAHNGFSIWQPILKHCPDRIRNNLAPACAASRLFIQVAGCHAHLATGQEYRNLGPDYYEHRDVDRARARAVHALERLGVKVTVEAVA